MKIPARYERGTPVVDGQAKHHFLLELWMSIRHYGLPKEILHFTSRSSKRPTVGKTVANKVTDLWWLSHLQHLRPLCAITSSYMQCFVFAALPRNAKTTRATIMNASSFTYHPNWTWIHSYKNYQGWLKHDARQKTSCSSLQAGGKTTMCCHAMPFKGYPCWKLGPAVVL